MQLSASTHEGKLKKNVFKIFLLKYFSQDQILSNRHFV